MRLLFWLGYSYEGYDRQNLQDKRLVSIRISWQNNLREIVAFCSNGTMQRNDGKVNGVATPLKTAYSNIEIFNCKTHRLELAVNNTVGDVNGLSHFRALI
jgi:hypothetical protein